MPRKRSRRKGVKTTRIRERSHRGKKYISVEEPKTRRLSRVSRFVQSGGVLGRFQRRKEPKVHYEPVRRPEVKKAPSKVYNPYQKAAESERKSSSVQGQRVTFTQTVPSRTLGVSHGGSSEVKVGGEPLPPKS